MMSFTFITLVLLLIAVHIALFVICGDVIVAFFSYNYNIYLFFDFFLPRIILY